MTTYSLTTLPDPITGIEPPDPSEVAAYHIPYPDPPADYHVAATLRALVGSALAAFPGWVTADVAVDSTVSSLSLSITITS